MTFDPTINAGNVILMSLALIGFIGGWYKFGGRLDMLEFRAKAIEETLKVMASAIEKLNANEKQIALLDQRVTAVETSGAVVNQELYDLRRGVGFVQGRRGNVDGEYTR